MSPNNRVPDIFHKGVSGIYPNRTQRSISTSNTLNSDTGSSQVYHSESLTSDQSWKDESCVSPAYEDNRAWPEVFSRLPDWTNTNATGHEEAPEVETIFGASSNYLDPHVFDEAALFRFFNTEADTENILDYGDTSFAYPLGFIDTTDAPVTSNEGPLEHDNLSPRKQSDDHSSSSSLVVLTPPDPSPESGGNGSQHSVSDEHLYLEAAHHFGGPCSNAWQLPQWRTRKSKRGGAKQKTRKRAYDGDNEPPRRRPFEDPQQRETTALTRRLKACIRCRMQKIRCHPNPDDPFGPCLTCSSVTGPTISSLNCLRYKITDASLYREQDAPYHMWSRRWKNMELVDISDWASDEVKTITISQIFLDAPYDVKVRKYIPQEGDMIEDGWFQNGRMKKYAVPLYALCDLEETAAMLEEFIDRNISTYITGAVSRSDPLILDTYVTAFKHYGEAQTPKERELILDSFRLWVACRKTSNPHRIYGTDKLGAPTVRDPGSLFNNVVPMPVIMIAQMELIMYTRVLRPASKRVLDSLKSLVLEQKPCYWYTIYLCCFMLLHSCAMQTKRDEETARQYNLRERFCNPRSIQAHHSGAQTMLAHWHYVNKGSRPFHSVLTPEGLKEVKATAQLTDEQTSFISRSARAVRQKESVMKRAREQVAFGDDWYWISQLYDETWEPGETA